MLAPVVAGDSLDASLDAARAAGVGHLLCVGVDPARQAGMLDLIGRRPSISCSAGLHPCRDVAEEPSTEAIARWCADPRIVAVGETGLDYHYVERVAPERQRARFRSHLRAARSIGLPVIVHTRAARADTLAILREERAHEVGGVLHCFTEDLETARAALDLGFVVSFSGIVTFRNAAALREVACALPLDAMLVETDAPYLAPVPLRGKDNEPAFVRIVAELLAGLRGEAFDEFAAATTANFFRVFDRAQRGA